MQNEQRILESVSNRLEFINNRVDDIESFIDAQQMKGYEVSHITITNLELNKDIRDTLVESLKS